MILETRFPIAPAVTGWRVSLVKGFKQALAVLVDPTGIGEL